uniref:Uncharacterized protein n=1 Tax=Anguilla anguilla TaxID=7936 RepID=A0A0E9UZA4_ANGAN
MTISFAQAKPAYLFKSSRYCNRLLLE